MARESLSKCYPPSNKTMEYISKKREELQIIFQEMNIKKERNPFETISVYVSHGNNTQKISAYYLSKALIHSRKRRWEKSLNYIEKSKNLELTKITGLL